MIIVFTYKTSLNLTSFGPIPKKVSFKLREWAYKDSNIVKKKSKSKPKAFVEKVVSEKSISKNSIKCGSKKVVKDVFENTAQFGSEKELEKVVP